MLESSFFPAACVVVQKVYWPRSVKIDCLSQAPRVAESALVAGSLILELVRFRHGDEPSRAGQNLFFKRTVVKCVH